MTDSFYADLPLFHRFDALADPANYTPAPADWFVVITDVEGSTQAVAAGRYRDVNFVGAACIAAVLNAAGETDVPFVFGGDGATLLVPPSLMDALEPVLRTVQGVAREGFGLGLRVGVVPVAEVYARGARVDVLRHVVSSGYTQAMVSGGGLALAEGLVKGPETAAQYALPEGPVRDDPTRALFDGMECRWDEIESPQGEMVALLATALTEGTQAQAEAYRAVLGAVERAYGSDEGRHPLAEARLRLAWSPRAYAREAAARAAPARRAGYQRAAWLITQLGRVLMALGVKTSDTDWGQYTPRLRASTDYRKFDDTLRMILSGTPAQRAKLETELAGLHAQGLVAYGLHASARATLTCLVFDRMGRRVHFVDGADGGYTTAARQLKAQLKASAAS